MMRAYPLEARRLAGAERKLAWDNRYHECTETECLRPATSKAGLCATHRDQAKLRANQVSPTLLKKNGRCSGMLRGVKCPRPASSKKSSLCTTHRDQASKAAAALKRKRAAEKGKNGKKRKKNGKYPRGTSL